MTLTLNKTFLHLSLLFIDESFIETTKELLTISVFEKLKLGRLAKLTILSLDNAISILFI
ncbi:hypothetical protein JCM30197_17610 [Schleiferia thermophila]|nr:hypothetical protein JCM30197_17610 [Schleiferia thermophila]